MFGNNSGWGEGDKEASGEGVGDGVGEDVGGGPEMLSVRVQVRALVRAWWSRPPEAVTR